MLHFTPRFIVVITVIQKFSRVVKLNEAANCF